MTTSRKRKTGRPIKETLASNTLIGMGHESVILENKMMKVVMVLMMVLMRGRRRRRRKKEK